MCAATEAMAREQTIEVNAVDAGGARCGANTPGVVFEQCGEVRALEPRGPFVARLLERA